MDKPDGRRNNGGKREGAGLKKGTQLPTKRTYDPEALADVVATKVLAGGKITPTAQTGPITSTDAALLNRIAGQSVEVFNEYMATRLRTVADKTLQRIEEKLDSDSFKSGELGFILSVAHDKRLSLDGSRALQSSSVNIQVNNYGASPKEALLADLDGLSSAKQVQPPDYPPKPVETKSPAD